MIPFAAYTTAETHNAFHWARQPRTILDLDPHLIHGSRKSQFPILHFDWFSRHLYMVHKCDKQTDTQTDRLMMLLHL